MKTIGELIKKERVKKRSSRARLEKVTKIRKDYISAIEEEDWDKLPERPVVAGFVNSIAQALNIERKQASALFRRDYPPKKLRVSPKPDILNKFVWSPRLTFLVGIVAVIIVILSYLTIQYTRFIQPPVLEVTTPSEGQIIKENIIRVTGTTDPDASVVINNQPVIIEEYGSFLAEIEIFQETYEIVITAKSRSGKETVIRRKIIPELDG